MEHFNEHFKNHSKETELSQRELREKKLKFIEENNKGIVEYGFTNDYMFRAVLQKNNLVLTELVRVLLGIPHGKKVECEVTNAIMLGENMNAKDCVLDIRVSVNGQAQVNMEMQMSISLDWVKRSMYYGFGMYVDLKKGEEYSLCKPTYHFGFVKRSPFSGDEKFFSTYMLTERETGRIYSGDFQISMINLGCIENATEKDRESGLYDWVRLFVATEWKELIEMARQSEAIGEAVVTFAELSSEENIRQQCAARKMYEMDQLHLANNQKRERERIQKDLEELRKEQSKFRKEKEELGKEQNKFRKEKDELGKEQNKLRKEKEELRKEKNEVQKQQKGLLEWEDRLREREQGAVQYEALIEILVREKRFEELSRAMTDREYRDTLLRELRLGE